MDLFAPGMSAIHRAGLGGLACTLKAMERLHEDGALRSEAMPDAGGSGLAPWEITQRTVTLNFGSPDNAGPYLKKLFAFAFQTRDGLIFLPGQYGDVPPSFVVLAAIQEGIQNTFLQHGPTCGSRDGERSATVEVNDIPLSVTHDVFTSYKHQGWFWLDRDEKSKDIDPATGKQVKTGKRLKIHQPFPAVNDDGTLSSDCHEIDNKLYPGGMVRHDRFKDSAIKESSGGLICLHFSLVGCLALCINRVTAALVIPDVEDLTQFADIRRFATPSTAEETRIAGAADAALQAQVRIYSQRAASNLEVPTCQTMTCRPTPWNKKQKPRVSTLTAHGDSEPSLRRFQRALALLPPQLIPPKPPAETGKRRTRKPATTQPFWSDSVVRPLIAENLALGRPWYAGFARLMIKTNPATGKPFRYHLSYEREGLQDMASDENMWDHEGEALVVKAVHEAIRQSLGRIREETDGKGGKLSQATKNRWERFREKLRLDLAGAKTEAHVRFALTDLFSRGGSNAVLRAGWVKVLPFLRQEWSLARDLGLLALASYAGKGEAAEPPAELTEGGPEGRS